MRYCWLCRKRVEKGNGTFFNVPKDVHRREKWSKLCGMAFTPNARICIDHFSESDIISSGRRALLLPNAMPIVKQEHTEVESLSDTCDLYIVKKKPELEPTESSEPEECFFTIQEVSSTDGPQLQNLFFKEQQTQTDPSIFDMKGKEYEDKINQLEAQNRDLKNKLSQANAFIDSMHKAEVRVRKLMSPANIRWRSNNISGTICLHASVPKNYYHKYKEGFQIPNMNTMQSWCRKTNLNKIILNHPIELMRRSIDVSIDKKICAMAFNKLQHGLRKYILERNTEYCNGRENFEEVTTNRQNTGYSNTHIMEYVAKKCNETKDIDGFEQQTLSEISDINDSMLDDCGILQEDALEYVSSYIIQKFNLLEYLCDNDSYTWPDRLSKWYLRKPSNKFVSCVKEMESIFHKINGYEISCRPNLHQYLVDESRCVNLPEHVKNLFFKCRIDIRIRNINKRIKFEKNC